MLIVFNGNQFINLENVGHALVEGKTIGFYLNSGESRHFPFNTEEDAQKAFDSIISETSRYIVRIKVDREIKEG